MTDTTASRSVDVDGVITTVGVGVPQQIPLASGPMTLAGSPRLDATVTSLALDGRVFLGLAVGTSPRERQDRAEQHAAATPGRH
ncbi:MAG: hypothetical protein WKF58_06830 [Ilumatobacteraceae bacterium]